MKKDEVIDSIRSLHDLSKAINSTLDIEEVVRMVMDKTRALMRSEKVLIYMLDSESRVLTLRNSQGFKVGEELPEEIRGAGDFDHCLVRRGRVLRIKDIVMGSGCEELTLVTRLLAGFIFAPLEVKGAVSGLIGVMNDKVKFSELELEIFCALGSQSAVAMENAGLYKRLKDGFLHTAEALAEAVGSRDPYTGGHTRRVVEYSLLIADALKLPPGERETLMLAATLHDIGKIGIEDSILGKGCALTTGETDVMKLHPEIGAKILSHVDEMRDVISGVRHHHEKYDGSGYPDGLSGEAIPLMARIIAIGDAFDALTTERPYSSAVDRGSACFELELSGGTHFDPHLVAVFCRQIREGMMEAGSVSPSPPSAVIR